MDVLTVNAQSKLMNFAASVGQSPQSWRGWTCLRVTLDDLSEDLQHECLFWAKSLLMAYLESVEGRMYFCENHSIHIVCKGVPTDVLEHAGQQICDLAYSESGAIIGFDLFDLTTEGHIYAHSILEQPDNILYRLKYNVDNLNSLKEGFMVSDMVKPQTNTKTIDAENTKVLLVEDDPVTRWLVRNVLKESCDLVTAPSANKAFSLYTSYQPDVVFLDINLPDKDGYEVLSWIKRNDPGANVVMFSSQDHLDNITQALEQGANGFIGKPFVTNQLLDYIHGNA